MTTTMFGMLRAGAAIVFVLAMAGLADADGNTLSADGLQSAAHQGNAEAQYWLVPVR